MINFQKILNDIGYTGEEDGFSKPEEFNIDELPPGVAKIVA